MANIRDAFVPVTVQGTIATVMTSDSTNKPSIGYVPSVNCDVNVMMGTFSDFYKISINEKEDKNMYNVYDIYVIDTDILEVVVTFDLVAKSEEVEKKAYARYFKDNPKAEEDSVVFMFHMVGTFKVA